MWFTPPRSARFWDARQPEGHTILQIYSRNASAASELAYEWNSESTNYISLINKNADVYLVTVNDDAIATVAKELLLPGKVVAHTAASVPKEILKTVTAHYGVFYPLQSLRKEMSYSPDVPVFFDGSDELTKKKLELLAHSIAKEKVTEAGDDARLKLHVAAVVVSNFTNHMYVMAEEYCRKEGLDFRQLLPLIEETTSRIKDISPPQVPASVLKWEKERARLLAAYDLVLSDKQKTAQRPAPHPAR